MTATLTPQVRFSSPLVNASLMRSFLFFQTSQPTPLQLRPHQSVDLCPKIRAIVLTPLIDDKCLLKYRNSATASSSAQVKVHGKKNAELQENKVS